MSKPEAPPLPVLFTVDDAAEALSLHPDQVRRLVRRGELVGYRLGRAVRIDADSVRAYLARCRIHVPQLVPPPVPQEDPWKALRRKHSRRSRD